MARDILVTPSTDPAAKQVSTEEVTNLNGVAVAAEQVQRVLPTIRTAANTVAEPATGAGVVGATVPRVTLASDDPVITSIGHPADAAWDGAAASPTLIAVMKAGVLSSLSSVDSPVEVHQPGKVLSFAPVLDASGAYAVGDILFATAALNISRINDATAYLISLTAIDKAKQHPGITIFFWQAPVASAAANAPNALSDADAITCLGFHSIVAGDWKDLANNSFACFKGPTAPNLLLQPEAGTQLIHCTAVVDAGTPTYALLDLMFKFGLAEG